MPEINSVFCSGQHTEPSQTGGLVSLLRCGAKCPPVFSLNMDLSGYEVKLICTSWVTMEGGGAQTILCKLLPGPSQGPSAHQRSISTRQRSTGPHWQVRTQTKVPHRASKVSRQKESGIRPLVLCLLVRTLWADVMLAMYTSMSTRAHNDVNSTLPVLETHPWSLNYENSVQRTSWACFQKTCKVI